MRNKEEFIESVLNSTENKILVVPNACILDRIYSKIEVEKNLPNNTKWLVAAVLTILFGLNAAIIIKENITQKTPNQLSELVPNTNNQLY